MTKRPVTRRRRAVLSVGSNLGDRLGTLQGCVKAIGALPDTDVLARSPVYETAPVGGPAQPDYLNAVLIIDTGLAPRALLTATQRIEADFGRVRAERSGRVPSISTSSATTKRSAATRCLPCPTPARASGRSSWRRGATSTRPRSCPATGPSRPCSAPGRSSRRRLRHRPDLDLDAP